MKSAWFIFVAAAIAGCSGGSGSDSSNVAQPAGNVPPPVARPSNKPMPTQQTAMLPNQKVGPGGPANAPADTTGVSYGSAHSVFMSNCAKCHTGPAPKFQLDVSSYAKLMKGGKEGPVIVAGDVDGSLLVKALHGKGAKQMPPTGAMSAADIKTIEDWIKAGAKES
jgi:mono/diheme cytochrome c family protein